MRSLFGAATLGFAILTAAPAFGRAIVPLEDGRKVETATFRADGATGRAWIEVTVNARFLSGKEARRPGTAIAVAVPGLAFDRATNAITMAAGDRRITCATAGAEIAPTGACRIDAKVEPVSFDTGFGIAKRDALVVDVVR